jgi:hypothetical protein
MKKFKDRLPNINKEVLKELCKFFNEINKHSEYNKMNTENISICFQPNLFKPKKLDSSTLLEIPKCQEVLRILINDSDYIFNEKKEEESKNVIEMENKIEKRIKKKTIIQNIFEQVPKISITENLFKDENIINLNENLEKKIQDDTYIDDDINFSKKKNHLYILNDDNNNNIVYNHDENNKLSNNNNINDEKIIDENKFSNNNNINDKKIIDENKFSKKKKIFSGHMPRSGKESFLKESQFLKNMIKMI